MLLSCYQDFNIPSQKESLDERNTQNNVDVDVDVETEQESILKDLI